VITRTKSSDQLCGGILCPLQKPGKNEVAVIKSTADKSRDQTGSHLLAKNASDDFQATKMEIANTGCLADLLPHRQLTVQDDA
jgi:hypothetical protein